MPPRYAYWTILVDGVPTAFRAREREELLPTLHQLQRKNPTATMKWFARGKLWESREAEHDDFQRKKRHAPQAAFAKGEADRERRGADWRPGGAHKDPRDRFKKKARPERAWEEKPPAVDRPPRDRKPWQGDKKPWQERRPGPPRGDRPWSDKPPGDRPHGDRPWSNKPPGDRPRGDRPWSNKPPGDRPRGDRPWSNKPPGDRPRGDRPWSNKPPGDRPRGDRPWSNKPPGDRPRGDRPWDKKGGRGGPPPHRKRRDDEPPDE